MSALNRWLRKDGKKGKALRPLRALLIALQRTKSPEKIALGFALGVAISVFPLPVIGMFIAFFFAWLFKANMLSAYVGTLIVNPFTGVIFYAFDYAVGSFILSGGNFDNVITAFETMRLAWESIKRFSPPPMSLWTAIGAGVLETLFGGALVMAASFLLSYSLVYFAAMGYYNAKKRIAMRHMKTQTASEMRYKKMSERSPSAQKPSKFK